MNGQVDMQQSFYLPHKGATSHRCPTKIKGGSAPGSHRSKSNLLVIIMAK